MAEFDIISKELITTYPRHFVRFLLNSGAFEFVRAIETELRIVESREMDTLLLVELKGEESLVHIEFQTSDSTETPRNDVRIINCSTLCRAWPQRRHRNRS